MATIVVARGKVAMLAMVRCGLNEVGDDVVMEMELEREMEKR